LFCLVSLNLVGIRSAAAKGFEAWAEGVGADCMGLQEIGCQARMVEGRSFSDHPPLVIDHAFNL
jgi:exodeoxyribonuclease-3